MLAFRRGEDPFGFETGEVAAADPEQGDGLGSAQLARLVGTGRR